MHYITCHHFSSHAACTCCCFLFRNPDSHRLLISVKSQRSKSPGFCCNWLKKSRQKNRGNNHKKRHIAITAPHYKTNCVPETLGPLGYFSIWTQMCPAKCSKTLSLQQQWRGVPCVCLFVGRMVTTTKINLCSSLCGGHQVFFFLPDKRLNLYFFPLLSRKKYSPNRSLTFNIRPFYLQRTNLDKKERRIASISLTSLSGGIKLDQEWPYPLFHQLRKTPCRSSPL